MPVMPEAARIIGCTRIDRQPARNDARDASRDRWRNDRQRPMSREERDKLRQDIQDANREMRR